MDEVCCVGRNCARASLARRCRTRKKLQNREKVSCFWGEAHRLTRAGETKNSLCTCKDKVLSVNCGHKVGFTNFRFSASHHVLTMPARRKLSTFDRGRAIAWLQDRVSTCQVARRLRVSHSVIVRLHQRFLATNNVDERPRSGCPKKTTPRLN